MKEEIYTAIENALKNLGIEGVDFVVDFPTDKSAAADLFSNVAMAASKKAGQAPRVIAEQLLEALQGNVPLVETIEVAGPGFLNFTLSREVFRSELETALELGDDWGKNDSWKGKKVVVEYTDPNPFKPSPKASV